MSRREAIVGALALAAGTLLAQVPETAPLANGSMVEGGSIVTQTLPCILWHTASGDITTPVRSQALMAGVNTVTGIEYGIDGEVTASSPVAGVGVHGQAATTLQYGVLAENTAAGGTALKVNGQAFFSRVRALDHREGEVDCHRRRADQHRDECCDPRDAARLRRQRGVSPLREAAQLPAVPGRAEQSRRKRRHLRVDDRERLKRERTGAGSGPESRRYIESSRDR